MRIKIQQFLFGKSHSWSIVGQNLGREFIKLGHNVDFISTDGFDEKFCPEDLRPYVKNEINSTYDLQFSYTAPHNWFQYLNNKYGGLKIATWNFEYNGKQILPNFAKYYRAVNLVSPSSNFSKDVFINMGIPSNKLFVIPHGFNLEAFKTDVKTELKTKKSKKILLNIAQPHSRKNIPGALEAFGKAFNKNDDVCLVAKVLVSNKKDNSFDIDFFEKLNTFKKKFPNHAEIEVVTGFIQNVAEIYNACDINFSGTFAECFWLPGLESMAAGLINVCPNYGGQLDFCNENNSLLIDGKIQRAPRTHQYWNFNPHAVHFVIDTDDAAQKLQRAVFEYDSLIEKFSPNMKETAAKFTWANAAKQMLSLVVEKK